MNYTKRLVSRAYRKKNLWKRAFKNVNLEDVIKPIYRKFIEPFLEGQSLSPIEIVKLWFNTDTRDLYFAQAKKEIKLPGSIRNPDTNQEVVPSLEQRLMKKGDQMTVRFDRTRPKFVELEFNGNVFLLRLDEWNLIAGSIALVA